MLLNYRAGAVHQDGTFFMKSEDTDSNLKSICNRMQSI